MKLVNLVCAGALALAGCAGITKKADMPMVKQDNGIEYPDFIKFAPMSEGFGEIPLEKGSIYVVWSKYDTNGDKKEDLVVTMLTPLPGTSIGFCDLFLDDNYDGKVDRFLRDDTGPNGEKPMFDYFFDHEYGVEPFIADFGRALEMSEIPEKMLE